MRNDRLVKAVLADAEIILEEARESLARATTIAWCASASRPPNWR